MCLAEKEGKGGKSIRWFRRKSSEMKSCEGGEGERGKASKGPAGLPMGALLEIDKNCKGGGFEKRRVVFINTIVPIKG